MFMTYYAIPDTIGVASGTVDEQSVQGELPKVHNHIFVKDKAKYHDIPDDGAPRYEAFPPGFEEDLEKWKQQVPRSGGLAVKFRANAK